MSHTERPKEAQQSIIPAIVGGSASFSKGADLECCVSISEDAIFDITIHLDPPVIHLWPREGESANPLCCGRDQKASYCKRWSSLAWVEPWGGMLKLRVLTRLPSPRSNKTLLLFSRCPASWSVSEIAILSSRTLTISYCLCSFTRVGITGSDNTSTPSKEPGESNGRLVPRYEEDNAWSITKEKAREFLILASCRLFTCRISVPST